MSQRMADRSGASRSGRRTEWGTAPSMPAHVASAPPSGVDRDRGVLFVPGLVFFLGLSQLAGEATSLLAIIPVALIGAWRQRAYGNVRLGDGVAIGLLSAPGVAIGALLANVLPGRALELSFAA